MTLDVLFRSIGQNIRRVEHPELPSDTELVPSLQACDPSEAQIMSATYFLESIYGDFDRHRHSRAQTPMYGGGSRAQTPMMVWPQDKALPGSFPSSPPMAKTVHSLYPKLPSVARDSGLSFVSDHFSNVSSIAKPKHRPPKKESALPSQLPFWNRSSTFR
jgi:hypothetical protein